MPSKEEKEKRRKFKLEQKEKEQQNFLNNLPISKEIILEMFDFLHENDALKKCNHNFDITKSFLTKKNIILEKTYNWLEKYGGYCDCEILYNVEEKFYDD